MLCESSVVRLHSSHNVSTPFETILPPSPKKTEAKEARCTHAISKLSWVVKNTMCRRRCIVCWVVRETMCHVGAGFKNRNFVFLQKITREGISGDHGRN